MTITRNRSFAARAAAVLMALIAVAVIFSFSPAEITASASAIETENYSAVSANAKDNTTQVMLMAADTTADTGTGTNDTTGDDTYQTVINFFVKWIKRVGFLVAFVGAIMFALAIKNSDADQKEKGILTMVAGFIVAAICIGVDMFDLFS
ncbi:MAG: hypothetical protein E7493_04735 [Ruminococcus albus]|nr:hypothetical protein [Ruminococcus albus]